MDKKVFIYFWKWSASAPDMIGLDRHLRVYKISMAITGRP